MIALSKYAGSHAWLAEQRPDAFPVPASGGRALVPFCGAGSVVLGLYAGRVPVIVSDKNPRLVNAWVQVRDAVEPVIERLEYLAQERAGFGTAPKDGPDFDNFGRAHFEGVRGQLDLGPDVDRAACMLFVLRASFNGLWRVNQDGQCNSPYGKPGPDTDLVRAEELRRIAGLLQGADIRCEDFEVTLRDAREGDAAYLDPPFQGTHTAFCADGHEWEARQASLPGLGEQNARERLAAAVEELARRGVRWTLSDADNRVTRGLYAGWPFEVVRRRNSVTCKGEERGEDATELLVRNWQSPEARAA